METRRVSVYALRIAWKRYTFLFGEPPHGTEKQLAAMLELLPDDNTISELEEETLP